MKFYKIHAAKFKNTKVLVMDKQFTEIGPDAFAQSEFETIILTDRVTIIRDHAFAKVSACEIFVPASVDEIEPFAFDDMGYGNTVYCYQGTPIHKFCIDNDIPFSTDVSHCMAKAEQFHKTADMQQKAKEIIDAEKKKTLVIRQEAQKEAEGIKEAALAEARAILSAAMDEADNIKQEAKAILENAKAEAEELKKQAMEQAQKIREEAKAQANAAAVRTQAANQPRTAVPPVRTAPIFRDEERDNIRKPNVPVRPPVVNTPRTPIPPAKVTVPPRNAPIFKDEEHEGVRPLSNTSRYGAPIFRDEDREAERKSIPVAPKRKIPAMRRLDDYDEELKRMQEKKRR